MKSYRLHWMRSVPVPSSIASWCSLIALSFNFVRSSFNASLAISCNIQWLRATTNDRSWPTSAVSTANRSGVIIPRSAFVRSFGFFKSFKFDIRLRIRLRYLLPVSFNSWKIASSMRAANSTGSADPSGSSETENAAARSSRDFNLNYRNFHRYNNNLSSSTLTWLHLTYVMQLYCSMLAVKFVVQSICLVRAFRNSNLIPEIIDYCNYSLVSIVFLLYWMVSMGILEIIK